MSNATSTIVVACQECGALIWIICPGQVVPNVFPEHCGKPAAQHPTDLTDDVLETFISSLRPTYTPAMEI